MIYSDTCPQQRQTDKRKPTAGALGEMIDRWSFRIKTHIGTSR